MVDQAIRRRRVLRAGVATAMATALTVLYPGPVHGATSGPVPVVGYDISQTPRSGWGCWSHAYTGAIMATGRTVSGSVSCTPDGSQISDYSGGSGTINDGETETAAISNTHLFVLRNADDGQPIRPEITPRFAQAVFIDRIIVHGGDNIFSGAIDSASIRIGAVEINVAATPSGEPNAIGVPRDDVFDLTNTGLSTVATSQATLSNFATSFFGSPFDQMAVAEITVEGRSATVPVDIDIRPGSRSNVISLNSRIPIPVAVLSSTTFDIKTVDVATLTFGHSGDEDSVLGCLPIPDINRDHRPDLLCFAATNRTGFALGDVEGRLKGHTLTGLAIEGSDVVAIRR